MLKKLLHGNDPAPRQDSGASYTPPPVEPAIPSYPDHRSSADTDPRRSSFNMSTTKNILSSDVEIKGSLKFSNDLVIDGRIEGEVTSDGALTVGENARIKGEINTKSCIVFGKVEGNITVTERCELKNSAELSGDVRAKTLSIEEGAQFQGRSLVGAAAAKAAPAVGGASVPASSNAPQGKGSPSPTLV